MRRGMPNLMLRSGWSLPESAATPESVYLSRRQLLRASAGVFAGTTIASGCGLEVDGAIPDFGAPIDGSGPYSSAFPFRRNGAYTVDERPLTPFAEASSYNNFYEFTTSKTRVRELVGAFVIEPWTVEITGLCNRPMTLSVDDILSRFAAEIEERVYRHRCVEAWAMTVPWTGFELGALLDLVEPLSSARHVRFVSAAKPDQMPGLARADYPWPYHEGLSLAEAYNPLTLVGLGLYGDALPRQNGAPLRVIVPWKYGYKGPKSVVRIELVGEQPPTFWSTLVPSEYDYVSNVNPDVPHPRWSQATEFLLGTGERVATQLYNGYGEWVADLYR